MIEKRSTKNLLHEMTKKLLKSPHSITWNKGWASLEKQVSNMGLGNEKEQHRDCKLDWKFVLK